MALDISKAFDRVWHASLLHKLKSYGISGQIFGLISLFLSNRRLQVVQDGKSSQEYPVNAGVPQGSILGPTHLLLYINDLPDDGICNIAICADDTTLYSKRNQASDLWQQLQLASEGESDLRETVDCGKKYFRLTSIIRLVLLMGKRISLIMKKHHLLRCWVSLPNWIGALTLSLLLKLLLKKLKP